MKLFDKTQPSQTLGSQKGLKMPAQVQASNAEKLSYYNTVRTTVHNFDAIRLNAAIAGVTISVALIVAALNAIHYITPVPIPPTWLDWINHHLSPRFSLSPDSKFPAEYLFALFLCIVCITAARQFLKKIRLYSYFIEDGVDIAKRLEADMIVDEQMRLTHRFSSHQYAAASSGKSAKPGRVDKIFVRTLWFIVLCALLCLAYFLCEAVSEFLWGTSLTPKPN